MIQLNEISPSGYAIFLYSPDILAEFLKAEKCRSKKLCTYFNKNKAIFHKAIENGIVLPIYPISVYKYAIFVAINEVNTTTPKGWEQVYKYEDFFIRVGNSNKLCWTSFDYFEYSKETVDKRPTTRCTILPHGASCVELPVYDALDVEIQHGYYKYDLIAYKRVEPLDESKDENYGRNYAYGFHFTATDTVQNKNMDKDNENLEYDIERYCELSRACT